MSTVSLTSFSARTTAILAAARPAAASAASSLNSERLTRSQVAENAPSIQRHKKRRPLPLAASPSPGFRVTRNNDGGGTSTSKVALRTQIPLTRERRNSRSFVLPARAAGVAAGDAAATTEMSSSDELKAKGESFFSTDMRPVALFDGVCNMCNGGVNFMLENDSKGNVRFASLQSDAGRALLAKSGRSPDDISSIVLVYKDRSYRKSEAILRIGQHLGFPYQPVASFALILPLLLRDTLYDGVANNRYQVFGKTTSCRLSDPRFPERFVE